MRRMKEACDCEERDKPLLERNWEITQYKCNHSAFNGYHYTVSDYSSLVCNNPACSGCWRSKGGFVDKFYQAHGSRR